MTASIAQNTNRKNLLQLLWLRTIAIVAQMLVILFADYFLDLSLPLPQMFLVVAILAAASFVSFYRYKSHKNISDKSLFFELLFDVLALTAQLYFSGGIANPFISLFLLQVIIAAILLRKIYAWLLTIITVLSYVWLSFNYVEMHAFHHHEAGEFFNLHLQGMLVSYVFAAILLLVFITKIISNLQEKERLIKSALLATSAAHELSTPLTTISVILGDWKKVNLDSELQKDAKIIESQIGRCKKIISGILSSSESERAEQASLRSVKEVFDDLVLQWKNSRHVENISYHFSGEKNLEIIFDNLLARAFFNIFDNAFEASPNQVKIDVEATKKSVKIKVQNEGESFDKKILKQIGKPNISTKNSSGMGLFLALQAIERVGGKLKITNLENGAKIEIAIPLKNYERL